MNLKDTIDEGAKRREWVLDAARMKHGLESLDQVKHAVLEPSGQISIIPKS